MSAPDQDQRAESDRPRLSRAVLAAYGIGGLGSGVYTTVPGLLLLYYMTDTLGIAAALAGLGIFVPKLWDVITDPFMGSISDRTDSRFGRRRPYILAAALALPLCFVALFSVPELSPGAAFAWVMVSYVLAATAFTMFIVPYTAMPAEMSEDYDEVTSLMGWRVALLTVGILISGAAAPQLIELGGGGRGGYTFMAMIVAGVIFASMLGTFVGTRSAPSRPRLDQSPPLREQLQAAARVRPFRVLLSTYALQLVGVGLVLANVPYFARYTLGGDEGTVTIMFVALVAPAFAFMPGWVWLSKRTGKLRAYQLASALFGVGIGSLWLSSPSQMWLVNLQVGLAGIGFAGTQLFPFSMLPDTIAADRAKGGEQREGVFTGLWMAADKGAVALGALFAGLVLDAGQFIETRAGELVDQPDTAMLAIRLSSSILPALFLLSSLPMSRRYELDSKLEPDR
ncbi:MFS transporter [Plesiocystis pacifica]|uniref:MFS transporter n=1 Tax=Plesiocystis pacifica TaxID=191768 RepID=UPI0012FB30EA|nr:MFS transporter [Plesiocystis pacifica]